MLSFYNRSALSERAERLRNGWLNLCRKYGFLRNLFYPSVALRYVDETVSIPWEGERVLVFGPESYWAMDAELNVASENDAVKFAPSLFEVDEGYRFQAQKIGERRYRLIAFESEALAARLRELPPGSEVRRVTFAQWVFGDSLKPIRLRNGKWLTSVDGIIVEVDPAYVSGEEAVALEEALAHPPMRYKSVSAEALLPEKVTPKTVKTTVIVLGLVLGNLVAQGVFDYRESEALQNTIDQTFQTASLPETSIERDAIIDGLREKEAKQLRLREQCYRLSTLPLDVSVFAGPAPAVAPGNPEVVLIPGSKPGEPNRLLVGGRERGAASVGMSGIEAIEYDGRALKVKIAVKNADEGETVKNEIRKRLKGSRIDVQGNYVEARLK